MFGVFRKPYRRIISRLLMVIMLVGIGALPDAILCAAPGGHIAIEITGGGLDCSGLVGSGLGRLRKDRMGVPRIATTHGLVPQFNVTKPRS